MKITTVTVKILYCNQESSLKGSSEVWHLKTSLIW